MMLVARWDDDEMFGWGNRPVYTYFNFVYTSVFNVTIPTGFTLVLCAGVVAITLGDKVKNMQARGGFRFLFPLCFPPLLLFVRVAFAPHPSNMRSQSSRRGRRWYLNTRAVRPMLPCRRRATCS